MCQTFWWRGEEVETLESNVGLNLGEGGGGKSETRDKRKRRLHEPISNSLANIWPYPPTTNR